MLSILFTGGYDVSAIYSNVSKFSILRDKTSMWPLEMVFVFYLKGRQRKTSATYPPKYLQQSWARTSQELRM